MATTSSSTTPHRRRDSSPIGTAITAFFADPARRSLNSVLGNSAKERVASNSFSVPSTSGLNQTRGSSSQSQEHLSRQQLSAPYSQSGNAEGESVVEGLAYLGCSKMDDPTSEAEMLGIIATLNAEKAHDAVSVTLVIPGTQTGIIRLLESGATASSAAAEGLAEICSFPIQRIRFCARGKPNSAERGCFALSFTQLAGKNAALHQCHVFRCKLPEETARALFCFAQAFHRQNLQRVKLPLANGECDPSEELYEFEALLEIKEKDTRRDQEQGFSICPVERNCFKMRRDREKRVVVMLRQTAGPRHLKVTKCFGLLLAAGRNLRQSDMHLLDMHSASEGQQNPHVFVVEARWYPSAQNFEVLNTETPRETRVFMTIAVDVTLDGLNEAIRFNVECKARIFQQFERFWSAPHLAMSERYSLLVQKAPMDEQASTSSVDSGVYVSSSQSTEQPTDKNARKLIRFESATERQRCAQATKDKSPNRMMPTQLIHPADDDESDSDEPLLSGSGAVSRECSEDRLCEWKTVVEQWKQEPDKRPPGLNSLIYDGCPDVLRGEVWPLLARVDPDTSDLIQTYRMLLEKECPQDAVILRDIHRTFPAHDHFKESNELGQKSLYRISKAYSLYDEEVGYCQGLSFLAAALLLHMPEERAFCVLVRIMFDYGLRELFKTGFDALHLRFHQLQRLMEDYTHELYAHFQELGVETHMYASQWFLTLFTAKFPLQMVFFIVDLFLTEGINTIFHISLALLQDSKKELLQSDFEGVLKFFRVNLPRKYRTETNAKELIHAAVKLKISHKRLAKYEKEWHELKRRELESQDPLERLERENCRLKEQILRLERENDDLAHELVTSKIELRNKLDTTEDQLETTVSQLVRKSREVEEMGERECQLREESDQVKQRCRQEVKRLEEELRRAANVNAEYKRICSDLGTAADEDKRKWEEHRKIVAARVSGCERCSEALGDWDADSPRSRSQNGTAEEQNGEGKGECAKLNGASALHVMELVERLEEREQHIRQVELELAQTKLALVESQCQNQDLTHQMTTSMMLAQNCSNASNGGDHHHYSTSDSRPAWLKKTLSSLKEAHQAFGNSTSGHHRSSSNASMASMSVDSGR